MVEEEKRRGGRYKIGLSIVTNWFKKGNYKKHYERTFQDVLS